MTHEEAKKLGAQRYLIKNEYECLYFKNDDNDDWLFLYDGEWVRSWTNHYYAKHAKPL